MSNKMSVSLYDFLKILLRKLGLLLLPKTQTLKTVNYLKKCNKNMYREIILFPLVAKAAILTFI